MQGWYRALRGSRDFVATYNWAHYSPTCYWVILCEASSAYYKEGYNPRLGIVAKCFEPPTSVGP